MEKKKEHDDPMGKLYSIVREIGVAMMTTVREDGTLHTRPMATRFSEERGDLWFFTRDDAPKSEEVREDQHVSLAYSDPGKNIYAAIDGRATLVRDRPLMGRLWAPTLLAWFPHGPDDPNLALLRVKVRSAEYWDAPSSTLIEVIAAVQSGLETSVEVDTGDHASIKP